jgi:hypothetical protein
LRNGGGFYLEKQEAEKYRHFPVSKKALWTKLRQLLAPGKGLSANKSYIKDFL